MRLGPPQHLWYHRRAVVRNLEALLGRGLTDLRALALGVAEAGFAACDPVQALERRVALEGDALVVDGRHHDLEPGATVAVLGAGKASLRIAWWLDRLLGDRASGIVAVRDADPGMVPERVEVLEAGHPLPDERSVTAAHRLLERARSLGEDDLAVCCFTGGSSALASLPPEGVSNAEKAELHQLLLSSGMPIAEVNTVRKQVSAFKGGRFAEAVRPARLLNLTVSDVAGDALDALTDPSVPNPTTPSDAIALLRSGGLWARVPASVRRHLSSDPAPPDLSGLRLESTLLVTGTSVCDAMAAAARERLLEPVIISASLEGEAAELGKALVDRTAEAVGSGHAQVLIGCGGEATVTLESEDSFGAGGPNAELALVAAERLAGLPVAAVFADSDGSDGGSRFAGAVVDGETARRALEAGMDLGATLAAHRSGEALAALGDGILTGPTHTNVNDLFAIVVGAP